MCFNNSGAQYVRMPDCVVEIGVEAFKKSRLKEITFPKSLLSIKERAFELCELLNCDLTFNDNLQSIGRYAFNLCRSINYLAPLPTSLKQIEERAFIYCSNMKGNLIIPEGCSVGVGAFHFCYDIESLSLPDSMEVISDLAFCYLSSIKSISFPKKLRVIGSGAFAYCSSVSGDLIIPDTVETIEESAFRGCSSYDGILLIGSNCKYIGTDENFESFEGTKFTKVYCKAPTPPSVVIRGGKNNVGIRQTYLGVPAGTLSLYKSAEYWKDFTYIEEVDFNNL